MKHIYFIFVLLILSSCQESAKQKTSDRDEYDRQLSNLKSKRKDSVNTNLINNFRFGMTEKEVSNLEDSLVKKGILEQYSDKMKIYFAQEKESDDKISMGKFIEGSYRVVYENQKLNKLIIDIKKSDFKNALNIYRTIYSAPDLLLKDGEYKNDYAWIIGNQEITISYNYGFPKIIHYDYASVSPEELQMRINEFNRHAYITNDEYDGSVKQVVNYLNTNLKDSRSYESLSWSKVMHKDGYYMVRHKYRAKNNFGNYVIENKLFYIDLYGEIYKIEELNK